MPDKCIYTEYTEQLVKKKIKQLTAIYDYFGACPKYEFVVEPSIHTMVLSCTFILSAQGLYICPFFLVKKPKFIEQNCLIVYMINLFCLKLIIFLY